MNRRQLLTGLSAMLLSESSEKSVYGQSNVLTTIYLTIDDGPSPKMKNIVDILGDQAKATFFLIGENMKVNFPTMNGLESAKYAIEHGHEIGNHSYTHPWFSFQSINKAKDQIERTRELIERAYAQCGKTAPLLFRFPFGDNGSTARIKNGKIVPIGSRQHKQELASLLKDMGYSTYYWGVVNYPRSPQSIKPGSVVLTHDWPSGLGVRVSRDYINSNKFNLAALPIPAVPGYEVRYI